MEMADIVSENPLQKEGEIAVSDEFITSHFEFARGEGGTCPALPYINLHLYK